MESHVNRGRTPSIAIAGAGFGGLCMAIALVRAGIRTFALYERAGDVGGTWRENTYPGAACDVPSHLYSFSFERKHDWSRAFAEQPEILAYLQYCARKYGIYDHIRFENEIVSATFDEARDRWTLELGDGTRTEVDVFISACGQLNRPAIPAIPGRETIAGPAFHSAQWRHDVDLRGKRIAAIGTGASAVQFVPQIAPAAASLALYQRSAPYVIPKPDRAYEPHEHRMFAALPAVQHLNRARKYVEYESRVLAFSYAKAMMSISKGAFEKNLRKQIPDPALRAKVTPDYPMGCKRIMISNDYYPALALPNVEVVTDPIARIEPHAVVTSDGRARETDVIVYGTGFTATQFLTPMRVTGRDGVALHDAWRHGAEAYLGITVAGFPNFFMVYGPNTNLGHNSIVYMIEAQVAYVMDALAILERGTLRRLDVLPAVQSAFNERLQERIRATVWSDGCTSWYLTDAGKNTVNWPEFTFEYKRRTRRVDLRHYAPAYA